MNEMLINFGFFYTAGNFARQLSDENYLFAFINILLGLYFANKRCDIAGGI